MRLLARKRRSAGVCSWQPIRFSAFPVLAIAVGASLPAAEAASLLRNYCPVADFMTVCLGPETAFSDARLRLSPDDWILGAESASRRDQPIASFTYSQSPDEPARHTCSFEKGPAIAGGISTLCTAANFTLILTWLQQTGAAKAKDMTPARAVVEGRGPTGTAARLFSVLAGRGLRRGTGLLREEASIWQVKRGEVLYTLTFDFYPEGTAVEGGQGTFLHLQKEIGAEPEAPGIVSRPVYPAPPGKTGP